MMKILAKKISILILVYALMKNMMDQNLILLSMIYLMIKMNLMNLKIAFTLIMIIVISLIPQQQAVLQKVVVSQETFNIIII